MKSCANCWSASLPPITSRPLARSHIISIAALGGADRAHAVVDAPGAEAVLGDHESGSLLSEQVRLRTATTAPSYSSAG